MSTRYRLAAAIVLALASASAAAKDKPADSDGLHIATLLSALFLKHFPALVHAGHVFVAMPPLFRVDVGKQVF